MKFVLLFFCIWYSNSVASQKDDFDGTKTKDIFLSPNPISKNVTTTLLIDTSEGCSIKNVEVFNILGIKEFMVHSIKELDVSSLSSGVYIVRISFSRKQRTGLFVGKLVIK